MEDKIKVFLSNGSGSGYGYGSGDGYGYVSDSGYGYGYGYGSGSGSGYGDGYGYGSGSGSGYGYVSGYGDGYGYGSGSGDGSGYGSGDGSGYGYKMNNKMIYNIDGINTIINKIKGNIAVGHIINDDWTIEKTYITKHEGTFAHGKTIKEACESLENKLISELDTEEIIEMFLKKTDISKEYPTKYFFDWHGNLTGSCLQGRESFVKNNNIDINGTMTVNRFIEICKDAYGSEIIRQLETSIKERRC